MKKAVLVSLVVLLFAAVNAQADFVILRDGKSYSGTYTGSPDGKLAFKDSAGIEYTFPVSDVQSLVFSNLEDHVSLRAGQSYSGHLLATTKIAFQGANGVSYVFPLNDVASLVFTGDSSASAAQTPAGAQQAYVAPGGNVPAAAGNYAARARNYAANAGNYATNAGNYGANAGNYGAPPTRYAASPAGGSAGTPSLVIPMGTQISVRTDNAIDSTKDTLGQLYSARIEQDVMDSTGAVGIPAGTAARLQVVDLNKGTSASSKDLALDLYSVNLNGREYRVDTSSVAENGSAGFGMNRRTAEYAGGGAGLGALMGAVFGGGKGAGIGTLAGGGLGALTQYLTRGKQVSVPAETTLTFQVQQTLVMHP